MAVNMLLVGADSRPQPPPMRTATRTPVLTPRVMPAKTKIMSILDRARIAMEESYGYEEPYEPTEPGYAYTPSPPASHSRGVYHYEPDYEPEYYRESAVPYGKCQKGKPIADLHWNTIVKNEQKYGCPIISVI